MPTTQLSTSLLCFCRRVLINQGYIVRIIIKE